MIKNCKVLINNEYVTVVDFGDRQVQLPSIKRKANCIKVEYKDGIYTVLPDDYIEQKVEEGATVIAEAGKAIAVSEKPTVKPKGKTTKKTTKRKTESK